MLADLIFGLLTLSSLVTTLWQWFVGRRFPLHQRHATPGSVPGITVLKPLKGRDSETADCLESWLQQTYSGEIQFLFGVASDSDPVCELVRDIQARYPQRNCQLVIVGAPRGANAKVFTLTRLQDDIHHDILVVSDADVWAPRDLLANIVEPLQDRDVGLVHCFYALANPITLAMRWEAMAINADFWTQVLQAETLKPVDFALGAVMATTRSRLEKIGGFDALVNYLADDYQLGQRIARSGARIVLSRVPVECRATAMGFREVWSHQLRWARTIRICQPGPYFLSILSNATLWPLAWLLIKPTPLTFAVAAFCWIVRMVAAHLNHRKLSPATARVVYAWLPLVKDALGVLIWALAFLGNHVEWRGQRYRVHRGGEMVLVDR